MKLSSKVRFTDPKTQHLFEKLPHGNSEEKKLHRWLLRAFKDIEENAFCGIQIPTRLIPKVYRQKHNIENLWKYDLPNAWRLLYSIEDHNIIVISIVLEWMDHKNYERRFHY